MYTPAWSALLVMTLFTGVTEAGYADPGVYSFSYRTEDIPGMFETMQDSRIYYPDSAGYVPQSATPCPIVVIGHGFMMGIDRYFSYAEHLASWGYITVLPTFSNPLIEPEHYTRARCMVDAALFVNELDQTTGDIFHMKVDRTAWGFTGHSMGGGCAFLAADTFNLADTLRLAVSFCSPQTTPPVESSHLDLPKLVLAGSVDNIAPWNDVRTAMWSSAPAPGAFAVILGANHGYCMDYSYFWEDGGTATISREDQQRVIRLYLTAYMERYLHEDGSMNNFMFCYGDSIMLDTALDSVEVRLETGIGQSDPPCNSPGDHWVSVYPNPFSGSVSLDLSNSLSDAVSIEIRDLSGRLVSEIAGNALVTDGSTIIWNGRDAYGRDLPPGVYVLLIENGGQMASTCMLKI